MRYNQEKISTTVQKFTTISQTNTNSALKKMQRQILSKAEESLDLYNMDIRDQSAMTMAIRQDRIPEAKKLIKIFRRDMSQLLEANKNNDQVYQLVISLFPISNINHENSKKVGRKNA